MRKLLAVLAALVMCLQAVPAGAAALPYGSMIRIFARTAAGDQLVGTAFAITDSSVLTVDGAIPADANCYLSDASGQRIETEHVYSMLNGLVLMITKTAVTPVTADFSEVTSGPAVMMTVTSAGAAAISATVSGPVTWHGMDCLLAECDQPATLGSGLLDPEGNLIGIAVSEWLEAPDTYVILNAEGLSSSLLQSISDTGVPSFEGSVIAPEEYDVTAKGVWITVDLSDYLSQHPLEGGICYIGCGDTANPYFSYAEVREADDRTVHFSAVPGHTYQVKAMIFGTEDSVHFTLEDAQQVSMLEEPPYRAYSYEDRELWLGTLPTGTPAEDLTLAEKLDTIDLSVLQDEARELYLQARTVYSVAEQVEYDLLTVLTTPEGWTFCQPGGFWLMPELQQEDDWHCNLSPLFRSYLQYAEKYAEGEYRVTYYFDGMPVNQISFELAY